MATFELYRRSTIGMCLTETLDEMVSSGTLSPELAIQVLVQFDKSMTEALESQVKSKVTIKGHLHTYRFCDNVWTFILQGASFKNEDSTETVGQPMSCCLPPFSIVNISSLIFRICHGIPYLHDASLVELQSALCRAFAFLSFANAGSKHRFSSIFFPSFPFLHQLQLLVDSMVHWFLPTLRFQLVDGCNFSLMSLDVQVGAMPELNFSLKTAQVTVILRWSFCLQWELVKPVLKTLKLNHGSFRVEIPEYDASVPFPSIAKDLIDWKAYLIWESRGRRQSSMEQQEVVMVQRPELSSRSRFPFLFQPVKLGFKEIHTHLKVID
ncbi:hypothetical protein DITRI_Ditri03aG0174300 [Diplodiscus trichospermus]